MTQWEYATDTAKLNPAHQPDLLNKRGLDGWELVALSEVTGYAVLYWKRPLITPWQDVPEAR